VNKINQVRFVWKPLIFLICLVPLFIMVLRVLGIGEPLGPNPIEAIQDHFGEWGLRFIMITLAITPLRKLSGQPLVGRFRRMLGLFAFFYVVLHFLVWLLLDQELLLPAILEDIVERPFITIGMAALLILLAMAATSTAGMRRRMGRRWQQLHYGAYAVGVLGVWHYWWQVKKDISEPLVYAIILAILLGFRLYKARQGRISPTVVNAQP
jgi:sulfoxide reductase heme-binding subunit YedZ